MEKYKIIQHLGQGNFGNAYKVLNKKNNNIYVMKKLPKNVANDKMQQFKNEAKILSTFKNEHIVKYYESFYSRNSFNIVMEYCEGSTIKSFIDSHKRQNHLINKETIYKFIVDICEGLNEIHNKNIIHKDLKPDNLFLTKDLKVKIGDFGISKKLYDSRDYARTVFGPIMYMAPEEMRKEKYNNKIDIWSLGCVIHELCTLEICFQNPQNIIEGRYKRINVNYYGNFLQNLIDILLNQNYHKRPNAGEIIDFINKKEIPKIMVQHHSHHNDFSNSHFDNHDVFRPHSSQSSLNKFSSKTHRIHHGRNSLHPSPSFISNTTTHFRARGPFKSESTNFPLDYPNIPPQGLTRCNSFIPHEFPIFSELHRPEIFEPIKPPHLIPPPSFPSIHSMPPGPGIINPRHKVMNTQPNFAPPPPIFPQTHFMPTYPSFGPPPPHYIPPSHGLSGPIPPPLGVPLFPF